MPAAKTKLPKNIAAVRFLKSKFKKSAAVAWLKKNGLDTSLLEETKGVYEFAQKADADKAGAKTSLGSGIIAVIAKAKKADDEEDDDKDKEDDELENGKGTVKADDMPEEDDEEEKDVVEPDGTMKAEDEDEEDKADDEDDEDMPEVAKDADGDDDGDTEADLEKEDKADEPLTSEDGPKKVLPGLQTLADRCNHAMGVMKYCKDMLENVEHPGAKESLQKDMEEAQSKVDDYHKLAAEHYPDDDFAAIVKAGGFDNEIEDKADDEDDSTDKPKVEMPDKAKSKRKPMAKGTFKKSYKACIKAAADHMGDLAAHADIPPMHKAGLMFHAKALNDVIGAMDAPSAPDMVREPKQADDAEKQEEQKALKAARDVTAQAKSILGDFAALATFGTPTKTEAVAA